MPINGIIEHDKVMVNLWPQSRRAGRSIRVPSPRRSCRGRRTYRIPSRRALAGQTWAIVVQAFDAYDIHGPNQAHHS